MEFTHFDPSGKAWMVDVSGKDDTRREATAAGEIRMSRECYDRVAAGTMEKGDVLGTARIAGIMGAKKTSDLIPLCHILNLTKLSVEFELHEERNEIRAFCTAKVNGKTGVEMEALTGVSTALLTVYDMCKAVDKTMEIGEIRLYTKTGAEMEALTGVSCALLTIYDMCKAVDKTMEIGQIMLVKKNGGKSGDYVNPKADAMKAGER